MSQMQRLFFCIEIWHMKTVAFCFTSGIISLINLNL